MDLDREAIRAQAAQDVREALGIEPATEALFARIAHQLGADEMGGVIEAVWQGRADRRHYSLASIAAASLAIDHLGAAWWHEARVRTGRTGVRPDDRSPATLLRSPECRADMTNAEILGLWAGDDVADHLWGPPVAFVDLHWAEPINRFPLPKHAQPGDRLSVAWDPGCRVEAVVEVQESGELGSRLALEGELLYAPPCDLWWNWVTATKPVD